jgi:hypothetical protein
MTALAAPFTLNVTVFGPLLPAIAHASATVSPSVASDTEAAVLQVLPCESAHPSLLFAALPSKKKQ